MYSVRDSASSASTCPVCSSQHSAKANSYVTFDSHHKSTDNSRDSASHRLMRAISEVLLALGVQINFDVEANAISSRRIARLPVHVNPANCTFRCWTYARRLASMSVSSWVGSSTSHHARTEVDIVSGGRGPMLTPFIGGNRFVFSWRSATFAENVVLGLVKLLLPAGPGGVLRPLLIVAALLALLLPASVPEDASGGRWVLALSGGINDVSGYARPRLASPKRVLQVAWNKNKRHQGDGE